jgi:hypothetical protein
VRLGLVVEGEDGRTYNDPSMTTHPPQHRGLELDRQETSATEVRESSFSFCKLVPVWPFLLRRARSSLPG